eukprot:5353418-Alexandrium_andersonii.AAC.1
MEQYVEVYCQQFDVAKAQLSRRKVGTPFADDVKNTVLECGGHCTSCARRNGGSKASAPAGALFRPAAR